MELTMVRGGTDIVLRVPDRNVMKVITAKNIPPIEDVEGAVRHALENPIGSKRLSELVKPNYKVVIISNNNHNPGSYDRCVGPLIDELHKGGVEDHNIRFVFANGVHRELGQKEIEEILGDVSKRYEVTNNLRNRKFIFKGITPTRATPVWLNEECSDADITVGLGSLTFNPVAGYGGGCKSICPGVVSYDTICAHHLLALSPVTKPGNPECPARHDMEEMAEMANFKFIINVAYTTKRRIAHVVAGNPVKAHREGVKKVWEFHHFGLSAQADILIGNSDAHSAPGAPMQPGIYLAITMSHQAVPEGGTLIFTHSSEWPDHPTVHRGCAWWKECEDIFRRVRPDYEGVLLDLHQGRLPGWCSAGVSMTSKIMEQKEIFVVNEHLREEHLQGSGWKYSSSIDEALRQALDKHGPDAKVVILPQAGRAAYLTQSC